MQSPRTIKVIQPTKCPCCGKNYFICLGFVPYILWGLQASDIENIRKKARERINGIKFKNVKDKKALLDYVNSTPLGPEEINSVIDQMLSKNNENKNSDTDK